MDTVPVLGFVSNYSEHCGIASYAGALVKGLRKHGPYEVKVIPIDTSLFREYFPNYKKVRLEHFQQIAEQIKSCDAVNIQFENGLFGNSDAEVLRHLAVLLRANRNITITLHTAQYRVCEVPLMAIIAQLARFRLGSALSMSYEKLCYRPFLQKAARLLKECQAKLIVHTRREKKFIEYALPGLKVFNHPLAFFDFEDVQQFRQKLTREEWLERFGLSLSQKYISVFGFISKYKGHNAAIETLTLLPDNFELLVVGSQHPNGIEREREIDGYLLQLIKPILHDSGSSTKAVHKLKDRIKFLGKVTDDEMVSCIMHSDVCLFPYLEVGQSASGPASMALELDAPVLMTRAYVFDELSKETLQGFPQADIGNSVEMAQKVLRITKSGRVSAGGERNYRATLESNVRTYVSALQA